MKRLLATSILALMVGCASPTSPTADEWSAGYDPAWSDVITCWGVEPIKPNVVIREDCQPWKGGDGAFNVGNAVLGEVWVHGRTIGDSVEVCPDLAALRHEFSEWVKYSAPGGSTYLNGSGKCWL